MALVEHRFTEYTPAERRFDHAVHLIGVPVGIIGAAWLVTEICRIGNTRLIATILIYATGLVGMLSASAAYHLTRPGRLKELLRRADHAMIYVMIAGTYTPFALNVLEPPWGVVLCAAVWSMAAIGIALRLTFPHRFDRLALALYLGMGWAMVFMIRPLVARLPTESLALLVGGGLVYSLGALIYTRDGLKFHTAVWHVMVLAAAVLHLTALRAAFLSA
jgi:hemolysin III